MDEVLDVVELVAETGLEDVFAWLLRVVGVFLVLAGLGLWLLTEMGLLWLPAILMALGLFLLVAPQVLLLLAEVSG